MSAFHIVHPGEPIDETDLLPFPIKVPNPLTPPVEKNFSRFPLETEPDSKSPNYSNQYKPVKPSALSNIITSIKNTASARGSLSSLFSSRSPSSKCCNSTPSSSTSSSPTTLFSSNYSDMSEAETLYSSRSSSFAELIAAYQRPQNAENDAGNKPLDHYKSRLPAWRYNLRMMLLPIIRWETPLLATLQRRVRSTPLDIFFVMTANFGAHTFYVTIVPILFWLGLTTVGRDFVFVLAMGVYVTGFLKDLLCLPRPLSPPLHRLTLSGSAALEYGFPSTHTANALSVGLVWFQYLLNHRESYMATGSAYLYYILHSLNVLYVFSMAAGRLYCGMHGFSDVISGAFIGLGLWMFRVFFGATMDYHLLLSPNAGYWISALAVVTLILIRIHPEPIDDCPCFDDGVAFIAVLAGVYMGQWHYNSKLPTSFDRIPCVACIPFNGEGETFVFLKSILRLIIGIGLISIWRPTMKRFLHEALPPIFRFVESVGLSMPRRFFVPASEYKDVPSIEDSTIFSAENIANLVRRIKTRSDSVGPQSTADVYESLAYREYQKQQKQKEANGSGMSYRGDKNSLPSFEDAALSSSTKSSSGFRPPVESGMRDSDSDAESDASYDMSKVETPRVRYDVEVITKYVVYSGIAIIVTDLCGIIFTTIGI